MLNHDELLLGLRRRLPRALIEEYPHTATLTDAAAQWKRAVLAICPHGAGCTNMIFMRPNSTVVEARHHRQNSRVHELMARALGHRYVEFTYDLTQARQRSQLVFARHSPYSSFVLDVPKLLRLLHKSGALDAFTPAAVPSRRQWLLRLMPVHHHTPRAPLPADFYGGRGDRGRRVNLSGV